MPTTLSIRLLGELELRLGDRVLPALESARAESLLAYLLLHRDAPQPRQRLAFLLWPDSTEPQARTNLRHVLHNLRRALPDADRYLEITPRTLRWRADAPFRLDVAAFEAALADGDSVAALRRAVDAYTGDLLEGGYDDWLLEERDRLARLHLDALERLAGLLADRGEHGPAIAYAERLVRHDPLREAGYRLLMRLHDARGERARALRAYHACAAAVERDLGVEPSEPTRAAYESLLSAAPADAAPPPPGASGFVGRRAERARLAELWEASERGRAQLVLVTGEPGIGKTRLVEELRAWCASRGAVTAEARSYPAEGALAYAPVVAWLRAPPLAARRRRLDRGRLAELGRLLPELDLPQPPPLPDAERRRRLFDALAAALLAPAAPLLLVADDLHRADPETLRFLHYLVRAAPAAPLLVAATARREEVDDDHPLGALATALRAQDRCTELELGRLSRAETAALAGLPGPATERLFATTEGNPLFVVEALRAGGAPSPRVQAVIEARLAGLSSPARELAGIAAAIGREFTADVLAHAWEPAPAGLVPALDELWRRRIVRERGPDAYDFSHDRIREVAYVALGPARRRETHRRVAAALERVHAGDPDAVAGELATHCERGGWPERAADWYARAAAVARRLGAAGEAVRLLDRAREQTAVLPAGRDRDARELELVATALAPLAIAEGFGAARLAALQRRGLALADGLGSEPAPPLLRSLAMTALSGSNFAAARRFAGRLRARGERDADDVLRVESDYVLGIAAFWEGELAAARGHFEAAIARYRPEQRGHHLSRYGMDPQAICLSRLANVLWFLGDPAAAAGARDRALALAAAIGDPATAGTVRVFAALLAVEQRDADAARARAAELRGSEPERAVKVIGNTLEALEGYVEVLDGRPRRGVARARRALEEAAAVEHAPGHRAGVARLLAAACVLAGDARTGLVAAEALLGPRVRLWEPEGLRLRAGFRAALGAAEADVAPDLARAERSRNARRRILAS